MFGIPCRILMPYQRIILAFCLSLLALGPAPTARSELPHFPLRTDWASDEVLAAPTAGGPETVPQQLFGVWQVSLCVKPGFHHGHAWIRYENIDTGEVHTIGRFQRNVRATRRRSTREILYPRTTESGLHWDYDWRLEHEVRQGKYVVGSVVVRDPFIFGHDDLAGHGVIRDNCITYARDAWQYYSGQHFDLALLHTPEGFLRTIESEGQNAHAHSPDGQVGTESVNPRLAERDLRRLPPVN